MRRTILTVTVAALAGLSTQWSRHSKAINPEPNRVKQSAIPSSPVETSASNGVKRGVVLQVQVEAIEGALKRESLKLKIHDLRDAGSDAETEIRFWVGFGMAYPRCFIMKELKGKREAFYIAPKVIGSKAGARGEVPVAQLALESPKSGWDEFAKFIKEQGIASPMKLSLDYQHVPDPDEESIAIEVQSHRRYQMVFYALSTKNEDGQKALLVCRKIEQEFGITLGCGKQT